MGAAPTWSSRAASCARASRSCWSVRVTAPRSSTACSVRSRSSATVVGDDVPLHGVLCFVEADWPLIGGSFTTRGVEALWPKKLYPKLRAAGPLDVETITAIHRTLAAALPPA